MLTISAGLTRYGAKYLMQAKPGVHIILVRHGKTAANNPAHPIVRAWLDNELEEEGRVGAQLVAPKIAAFNPKYIYHSDMMRDSETAHIIAQGLNISPEGDFDVRTWDVGMYTGKPESEVADAIAALYKTPWETPPGSSESFDTFSDRWLTFLENKLMQSTIPEMGPIVIVTHGRNIALADSHFNLKLAWEGEMPLPAGLALVKVNEDRSISVEVEDPKEKVTRDV